MFKSHLDYGRIPHGDGRYIYVARVGDRRLTQIGNIRNFIIIRKRGDPLYQFRFLGEGPDSVKVTELSFHEDVTFIIPRRITAP